MKSKQIILKSFNNRLEDLDIEVIQTELKQLKQDEILVNMKLMPINPSDINSLLGLYAGFRPNKFPAIPGFEGFGIVENIGTNIGQRVFPIFKYSSRGRGSWREHVIVNQNDLLAIPDDIDDETAAQLLVNPCALVSMLKILNIPKGEYLIQNASASVLGRQIIQLCKYRGIKTINFVRRSSQIEELKYLGADYVFCVESQEDYPRIQKQIKQITENKYAYAAIDAVGGSISLLMTNVVRNDGTIILYGLLDTAQVIVNGPTLLFKELKYRGFWLSKYLEKLKPEEKMELFSEVLFLLRKKIVTPKSGAKFYIEDVKQAILHSVKMNRGGKVLLSTEILNDIKSKY